MVSVEGATVGFMIGTVGGRASLPTFVDGYAASGQIFFA